MNLFREEAINNLIQAIDLDEYDDAKQDEAVGLDEVPPVAHQFLHLYTLARLPVLEVGCGSGGLFGRYSITQAIEPCTKRFKAAQARGGVEVKQNVVECMDFGAETFEAVIMLNSLWQVRSVPEAWIEINRVLKVGGVYLFNVLTDDTVDVVQGLVLGARNTGRYLEQFGFEVVGRIACDAGPRFSPHHQTSVYLAAEKVRDFDVRWTVQPQITDRSALLNYLPDRDWRLL